ncbi:hypothetical protein [Rhizobium sp. SAFR-030]|uniref:hypothetical protein n=1 Tax=Rhizobium sp. SAFR-030 TaxID=3387277 RepID=UPI003F8123AE
MQPLSRVSPLVLILAQRIWQGGAGLVTILLISQTMTTDEQGWYYSFLSFAALYTLFDLGLSLVLVQAAAHASITLSWLPRGRMAGEGSEKLVGLFASATRHYMWLAWSFAVVVLPVGWWFFSMSGANPVAWKTAWIGLTLVTSLSLLPLPILALVEGSGEIATVAAVRLTQALLGSAATWIVLVAGGGLWATSMMPLSALVVSAFWVLSARPGIAEAVMQRHQRIDWRTEIWPHQWRLGLSWLAGYLLTQTQTLVIFATGDATAAGQMGLSLTIANMLGLISQSFLARHVPAMAKAAARCDWTEMDRLFRRSFALFCITFLAPALVIMAIVLFLGQTPYSVRILPPLVLSGLLVALFAGQIQGALAMQLRSYRKEPLVWIGIVGAAATAIVTLPVARLYGPAGVVSTMLAIQFLFVLPCSIYLFVHYNRVWRRR